MKKSFDEPRKEYEHNALVQRFFEDREEGTDDFDIVVELNGLYEKNPPVEKENIEEVRGFSEFLRDTIFTCPVHYEKMMEEWGEEPPFMKSAGVTVNRPEEEKDNCDCSSCYRSSFGDEDDDDDEEWEEDDEEIMAIDLAYDMLDIIHDVSGKNDSYLLDFFAENARTTIACSENIKDRMEDTVVEFLKTYFLEGGILLFKNFRVKRNGEYKGSLMGFIAEEEAGGYGAIDKKALKSILKNTEYNLEKGIVVRQYDRKDFEPDDSGEE